MNNPLKFLYHISTFANNPGKAMQTQQLKQGDPFYLQLEPKDGVWVSGTPEAAKEIFKASPDTFAPFAANPIKTLLGPGSLLLLGGQRHICEKKAMSPVYHGEQMKTYGASIQAAAEEEINNWQDHESINVNNVMQNIAFNVITNTIFGIQEKNRRDACRKMMFLYLKSYTPPLMLMPLLRRNFWAPWRRFKKACSDFDCLLLEEIDDCRQNLHDGRNDMLARLLKLEFDNGEKLSDADLQAELRTMLVSYDSSANGLTWALYYGLSDPIVKKKLLTEIHSFGNNITIEEIVKLPYLTAVCQEAMRIHPIVPIVIRTLNKPFQFKDRLVEAGGSVGLSVTLLHTRKELWEHPFYFNPDRFIEREYSAYEYAPFGGGTRRCLGAAFALYEMKIILATLLLKASLEINPIKGNHPRLYGLTMGTKKPIIAFKK